MSRQVSLPEIQTTTAPSSTRAREDSQKVLIPPQIQNDYPLSARDEIIRSADLGKSKSNIRASNDLLQQQIHRGQTPAGANNTMIAKIA